ncbi:MAG: hypothetical protein M1339_07140 [Bacteroidetes bacterium]|nr:hypothetical protein [Bacteroidota bacterium]
MPDLCPEDGALFFLVECLPVILRETHLTVPAGSLLFHFDLPFTVSCEVNPPKGSTCGAYAADRDAIHDDRKPTRPPDSDLMHGTSC